MSIEDIQENSALSPLLQPTDQIAAFKQAMDLDKIDLQWGRRYNEYNYAFIAALSQNEDGKAAIVSALRSLADNPEIITNFQLINNTAPENTKSNREVAVEIVSASLQELATYLAGATEEFNKQYPNLTYEEYAERFKDKYSNWVEAHNNTPGIEGVDIELQFPLSHADVPEFLEMVDGLTGNILSLNGFYMGQLHALGEVDFDQIDHEVDLAMLESASETEEIRVLIPLSPSDGLSMEDVNVAVEDIVRFMANKGIEISYPDWSVSSGQGGNVSFLISASQYEDFQQAIDEYVNSPGQVIQRNIAIS